MKARWREGKDGREGDVTKDFCMQKDTIPNKNERNATNDAAAAL